MRAASLVSVGADGVGVAARGSGGGGGGGGSAGAPAGGNPPAGGAGGAVALTFMTIWPVAPMLPDHPLPPPTSTRYSPPPTDWKRNADVWAVAVSSLHGKPSSRAGVG